MITKQQLSKLVDWHYINSTVDTFPISGWKFHIFGDNIDDSYNVGSTLEPIMQKYGITMKIATNLLINKAIGNKNHSQYGKIATIYLNSTLFQTKSVGNLIKDIQVALGNIKYDRKGIIKGDKSIDGIIHYRYELSQVVNPEKGVDYLTYIKMYEPNRGEYNIPHNPDIEEIIKQ